MELKFIFISMILLSGLASGQIVSAELSKTSYTVGDNIVFTVTVTNPGSITQNYSVTANFVPVNELYGLYPMLEILELDAGESSSVSFEMYVSPSIPEDDWLAKVRLLEGEVYDDLVIDSRNISFEITGTLSPIDLEIFSCKDAECQKKSDIFYQNETIYIGYDSSVQDLTVSGTMLLPDDSEQSLSLPIEYNPTQSGTHIIYASAFKSGHLPIASQLMFGVLEAEVEIKTVDIHVNESVDTDYNTSVITQADDQNFTYLPPSELPFDPIMIMGLLIFLLLGIIIGLVLNKKN
jgi:uncharacterized repeat protein (TIGR01451 family)